MYKIEKEPWGYRLTFGGYISKAEMEEWVDEAKRVVPRSSTPFGVFVDMRELKPLAPDVQEAMIGGQQHFKTSGMERSVVIVDSTVTAMQFKRLGKESGIYEWERYLSSTDPDWEARGMAWIKEALDPDQVPA